MLWPRKPQIMFDFDPAFPPRLIFDLNELQEPLG
jgi:hypothetical protein